MSYEHFTCVLCLQSGVKNRHYSQTHSFRLVDHFSIHSTSAGLNGPDGRAPTYRCTACRPEVALFSSSGEAVLHYHGEHGPIVVGVPVVREAPEPELPMLTWDLFDQWARRWVAFRDEMDLWEAETARLQNRVDDLTRTIEDQRLAQKRQISSDVSDEFFKVYNDVQSG